ncbi:hypothetical protein GHT06_007101 [Daphnia sinensis]|uniref:Rod shape-determining protein MreC beta-barrel core domain-containing protein n=1 Tax=Daphnia sinensis TaxID=1820382 RepID=A0AAD5PN36_9CRUS|nr:hypothetical protein GHT06_007101 [Daphnia sinensis]
MGLFNWFTQEIAIDLGTANTLIIHNDKVVVDEPSIVAFDRTTNKVIAIGKQAMQMEGITEVEKRAVRDSAEIAGAKEVYLIHEPMAAAVGIGIDVEEPMGNMIIDIGGGTTEIAVIALSGIVCDQSIRVAGDNFDSDIVQYIRRQHNIMIGDLGAALPELTDPPADFAVQGRDLMTGVPKQITRASVWNSSNALIGSAYEQVNEVKSYLSLGRINDSLAAENAILRNQLKSSFTNDSVKNVIVRDSTLKQQYTYTLAKVINNSLNKKNNYLTINRGSKHGIAKGMGVTSSKGIVGIVINRPSKWKYWFPVWGEGNKDARYVYLKDIQSHLIVNKGDKVVTSEFSLFPEGTAIGYVVENRKRGGGIDLDIKVRLHNDFSTLQYVYVINNL